MSSITPQILLKAYAAGIFPMAESANDNALYWVEPDLRGILPLDNLHIPRSLKKTVRQAPFEIQHDTAFQAVIAGCSAPGPGRRSTWINARIRTLYSQLFEMGFCHCVECWRGNELVGGLYGVRIGGAFFGESMFSTHRDASKVALVHLAARLNFGGFMLLDAQFINNHLRQFGAVEVERGRYQELLDAAMNSRADFTAFDGDADPETVLKLAAGGRAETQNHG